MSIKPTTTIRIDPSLKEESKAVFAEIGINMSTAITAFLKAVIREKSMPVGIIPKTSLKVGKPKNAILNRAFLEKKDEFYTRYEDVAAELMKYQSEFEGKKVFCNCDDPFESAFFRFFVLNFEKFQLSQLICTCYSKSSFSGQEYPLEGFGGAYKAIVSVIPSESLLLPDGSLNVELLFSTSENSLSYLKGDGDFRSEECINLLKKSDIIVTNPPFSLFREYITLLTKHKKKFAILGNVNAATYKEVFPLFSNNLIWYGSSIRSGDRKFYVPNDYPLNASGCGIDNDGRRYIRVKGVRWITNMVSGRLDEPIDLYKNFSHQEYPVYDNYSAIEVGKTKDIPKDYTGLMGVPITFLDKYNPEQFEIIMLANGNARTNVSNETLSRVGYQPHPEDRGGVPMLNGKRTYARIIIRRKF